MSSIYIYFFILRHQQPVCWLVFQHQTMDWEISSWEMGSISIALSLGEKMGSVRILGIKLGGSQWRLPNIYLFSLRKQPVAKGHCILFVLVFIGLRMGTLYSKICYITYVYVHIHMYTYPDYLGTQTCIYALSMRTHIGVLPICMYLTIHAYSYYVDMCIANILSLAHVPIYAYMCYTYLTGIVRV